ncbi:YbgA family protein [Streptococcus sp. Marseille-P7376]|uniref:YbgA family protein n=1 Tax=Streptococcus sp. Marseille-P7376 TaxID=2592044 RepID=UPI0011E85A27|nr:YbgA family protein [Streptococcus sp. Marseille-P7376]
MENVNQISQCQTLWARNKYLVLSHSSKIYLEIRQYLKRDLVEATHVQDLIVQAVALPENRGQVCNAFQHVWGYFKRKASPAEKEEFMLLLERYQAGQVEQEALVEDVKGLLRKYPNSYLQQSTLIFGD